MTISIKYYYNFIIFFDKIKFPREDTLINNTTILMSYNYFFVLFVLYYFEYNQI